jgi:hypothetical protein
MLTGILWHIADTMGVLLRWATYEPGTVSGNSKWEIPVNNFALSIQGNDPTLIYLLCHLSEPLGTISHGVRISACYPPQFPELQFSQENAAHSFAKEAQYVSLRIWGILRQFQME